LQDLNLRHLYHFWVICPRRLDCPWGRNAGPDPQTLSGQLATFEASLGSALFQRANRSLRLTDFGQTVFGYADDMFETAHALTEVLRQPRKTGRCGCRSVFRPQSIS